MTRTGPQLGEDDQKVHEGVRVDISFEETKFESIRPFSNPYRYKEQPEPEKVYYKIEGPAHIANAETQASYMELSQDWKDSERGNNLQNLLDEVVAEM